MERKSAQKFANEDKCFRVILEGIDRAMETPESFALKLAMRTRTPVTRIKSVVHHIPCTIKKGLTLSQAKKFSALIEELGGIVSYTSRSLPREGAGTGQGAEGSGAEGGDALEIQESGFRGELVEDREKAMVCRSCGWVNREGYSYCSLCHEGLGKQKEKIIDLRNKAPAENPYVEKEDVEGIIEITHRSKAPLLRLAILFVLVYVIIRVLLRN